MEIFQPILQLALEPDGDFAIHAVTITPNSAFSAGRARAGVPKTVRITAETFAVLLPIRAHTGHARQILKLVRHHLPNLKLGDKHGKTNVLAFAMIGDQIVGSSSTAIRPAQECPKDPTVIDTSDWYAWLNRMPGGPPSFHVSGVVYAPTPGYDAALVPATPQGINPKELILDLQLTPRPGVWPQVITRLSVRYDQSPAGVAYTGVLVREPDGDATHLDVEEVQ